jgi:hypothetical protein
MSTDLHVENLNGLTFQRLSQDAANHGVSPSEWAAKVLEAHYPPMATSTSLPADTAAALQRLFGSWDEVQAREFSAAMAESDKIDESIWK